MGIEDAAGGTSLTSAWEKCRTSGTTAALSPLPRQITRTMLLWSGWQTILPCGFVPHP